jgi:co-chaperonin GroES (HSP10)
MYIMKKVPYAPIHNNLLAIPKIPEEQTVIPELAHLMRAEVVALGIEPKESWLVSEGAVIWFDKMDAAALNLSEELYYVIDQKAILVIEL